MGMQKVWVESNRLFLNYVAAKYRQSVRSSLLAREIVVTEVDEDIIPKFDTEEAEQKHLDSLKY